MAVQWRRSLETGIEEIDAQHKELFNRVNQLLEACNQRKGKEEIGQVLSFLETYVKQHFKDEEALQRKYKYPKSVEHAKQHTEFQQDVAQLKNQFFAEGDSIKVVLGMNRTVVSWLTQHIGRSDKELGDFLAKKLTSS